MSADQYTIPDRGTTTFKLDDFVKLWLDTPISPPQDQDMRNMLEPGTCVKQWHNGEALWRLCGRVHRNEGNECIVIGHGGDEKWEQFVWRGTRDEFNKTWVID